MADLTQLAGLLALARDPDASARARDYLYQQKLQEQEMQSRERLASAQMTLQESQFHRGQELSREQFGAEQTRLTTDAAENRRIGEEQFGKTLELQKDQLDEGKRHAGEMEKLGQQEIDLRRQGQAQEAINNIVDNMTAFNKAKGTSLTPADYLKTVGDNPQLSILLGAAVAGPEKATKKGQMTKADAQRLLGEGYTNINALTGGTELTPHGQGMAKLDQLINVGTAALDEPTRQLIKQRLSTLSPEATLDMGGKLTPEQTLKVTTDLGAKIAQVSMDGNKLDYRDQMMVSKLWNSLPDSVAKTEVLTQSIAGAAAAIGLERGLSPEQVAIVQNELTAALVAATDPENNLPLTEVMIPINTLEQMNPVGPPQPPTFGRRAMEGLIKGGKAYGELPGRVIEGIGSGLKAVQGGTTGPNTAPAGNRVKQGLEFGGAVAKQGAGGADSPFNYGGPTTKLTPIQQRARERSLGGGKKK